MYTRVGPVLMSVNPYKWIVGLYAEEAMLSYHGKAAMVEAGVADLAPHLFGVADHAYSQLVGSWLWLWFWLSYVSRLVRGKMGCEDNATR